MPERRLVRLLSLVTLLRARTARNAQTLAHDLNVSKRSLYRDLSTLHRAGVPCHFDRDAGGYRILGDFFLPPVQLTLGEALALSVLGEELAGRKQLPFLDEAWRAVVKVRSQLPAALREEVASHDGHVRVQPARVSPQIGCDGYFETLRRAIANRRKVRCRYKRSGTNADSRRPFLFRPYALLFSQRAWYVVGHSERRDAERSLKLNRFESVEATDRPYMIPPGWTLEKCLGKAWRMIRGDRRYCVRIRFDAEVARNVADTLWHPTQTIAWGAEGGCEFACDVDGLEEIVWWVLGYGPHAEVVAPAELRDRLQQLAGQTVATYGRAQKVRPRAAVCTATRRRDGITANVEA